MKLNKIAIYILIISLFTNYNIRINDPNYFWGHFQWIQSEKIYIWMILFSIYASIIIFNRKFNLKNFIFKNWILLFLISTLNFSIISKLSYVSILIVTQNIKQQNLKQGIKAGIFLNIFIGLFQIILQSDLNLTILGEINLQNNSFELFNLIRPYGLFEHPNIYGLSLILSGIYLGNSKIQQFSLLSTLSLQNLIANTVLNFKKISAYALLIIAIIIKNPLSHQKTFTDRIKLINNNQIEYKLKPWEIQIPHNIYQYSFENHNAINTLSIFAFIFLILIKDKKIGLSVILLSLLDHMLISQNFGIIFLCLIQTKINLNTHYKKIKPASQLYSQAEP